MLLDRERRARSSSVPRTVGSAQSPEDFMQTYSVQRESPTSATPGGLAKTPLVCCFRKSLLSCFCPLYIHKKNWSRIWVNSDSVLPPALFLNQRRLMHWTLRLSLHYIVEAHMVLWIHLHPHGGWEKPTHRVGSRRVSMPACWSRQDDWIYTRAML